MNGVRLTNYLFVPVISIRVSAFMSERIPDPDRNPITCRKPVSFNFRMSRLEGTVDGTESSHDDGLWSCHHKGQLAEA